MGAQFPERDFIVLEGDCNVEIPKYLNHISRDDPGWRLAPSFAFVDQFSAEIWWDTLVEIAAFRQPNWRGVHRKTELWLLFGDSFIPRGLSGVDGDPDKPVKPEYAERVDRMYGTQQWRDILCGRQRGLLSRSEWRLELVNLMRWRLEHDLNYACTIPLAVPRDTGQVLYHMIFATDEQVGDRIMTQVLSNADKALAQMRRDTKVNQLNANVGLFDVESGHLAADSRQTSFSLQPPLWPWRLPGPPPVSR
jgi:three-Cys-motif partner protein